jgi:hypothetical protein
MQAAGLPDDLEDDAHTKIELDMDESVAQGVYSNLVVSNFNSDEFVMDFAFIQPNIPRGKVRARVILTPKNAKRLNDLLTQNINHYEAKNGSIGPDGPAAGFNISFN